MLKPMLIVTTTLLGALPGPMTADKAPAAVEQPSSQNAGTAALLITGAALTGLRMRTKSH